MFVASLNNASSRIVAAASVQSVAAASSVLCPIASRNGSFSFTPANRRKEFNLGFQFWFFFLLFEKFIKRSRSTTRSLSWMEMKWRESSGLKSRRRCPPFASLKKKKKKKERVSRRPWLTNSLFCNSSSFLTLMSQSSTTILESNSVMPPTIRYRQNESHEQQRKHKSALGLPLCKSQGDRRSLGSHQAIQRWHQVRNHHPRRCQSQRFFELSSSSSFFFFLVVGKVFFPSPDQRNIFFDCAQQSVDCYWVAVRVANVTAIKQSSTWRECTRAPTEPSVTFSMEPSSESQSSARTSLASFQVLSSKTYNAYHQL